MITHSAKETGEDGGVRQNLKNRMGGGGVSSFGGVFITIIKFTEALILLYICWRRNKYIRICLETKFFNCRKGRIESWILYDFSNYYFLWNVSHCSVNIRDIGFDIVNYQGLFHGTYDFIIKLTHLIHIPKWSDTL